MIERFALRFLLLLLLGGGTISPLYSADSVALAPTPADKPARVEPADKSTNALHRIAPGRTDGRIAWVAAAMLGNFHYSAQRFDAAISSKFLDRYLDTLDSQHLHFTQGDLADFERYRTNLDRLTLTRSGQADTRPACEIFNRFMERLDQHVAYVDELLKSEKFTFQTDERIVINRHESPYPKDLAEAKTLWRERLRAEYLQEDLGKQASRKKAEAAGAARGTPSTEGKVLPVAPAPARNAEQETHAGPSSRPQPRNLQPGLTTNSVPMPPAMPSTNYLPYRPVRVPPVAVIPFPAKRIALAKRATALFSPKMTPSRAEVQAEAKFAAALSAALAKAEKDRLAEQAATAKAQQDRLAAEQARAQAEAKRLAEAKALADKAEQQRIAAEHAPAQAQSTPAAKPGTPLSEGQVHGSSSAPSAAPAKKTEAQEIVETLTRRYHRNLHYFLEWNNDDVLQIYLTTLAHVYDPHSDYFGRPQLDQFSISMNLSLFGIGAELSSSDDGYCTIRRLLPGGPAIKSKKIKENDRVIAVAQGDQPPVDIVDMSLNKAVQLIRGPKGTEVRLTVIPAGADSGSRTVISLIRDEIPLEDSEAKAKIVELADGHGQNVRIGVIDLPSFYATFEAGGSPHTELAKSADSHSTKSTTADVSRLLTKLKEENVKGIVLDLRYNGGGSLEEAIRLTGLFIKDGPVVQVRNAAGKVEEDDDTDPSVLYDGPLIVLTSRFSASASEILAGALQDYGRALIVGDSSTHGKGTVQMVDKLEPHMQLPADVLTNDPGALKITIKKFYRPSGASTQKKGVVPDIILPSVRNEYKDIGERALDNALEWDTIRSAKYDPLNLVAPYLPTLLKRSAQRVAADQEFAYVREDIELVKKQQADKSISLNEKQRLKEQEDADARQKARDKERLARKAPEEKVYELTVKQAALPGLPPPVQKTNSTLAKFSAPSSGASTNAPVAAAENSSVSPSANPSDDPVEEEKPPVVDATLAETEHILIDYLFLLPRNNLANAER